MTKTVKEKYDIGDIVFVNEYSYENNFTGSNHLFVVVNNDNEVIPLDYFGLIVSSHIEKSKEVSDFKYNEPLKADSTNGLKKDSIVKCDQLYNFPNANIQFKIGHVDVDDFLRFINTYNEFLENVDVREKDTADMV